MVLFSKMNKELALQEAASTGLKTMEHLIKLAANEPVVQVDCREITDFTIAKLKKANSMVGRTGHARFCHGPLYGERESIGTSGATSADRVNVWLQKPKREGSGSTSNFAPPSSVSLLSMAQIVSARKQSSATVKDIVSKNNLGWKVFPRKVIRTPMISSKITDIPTDECSWRKCGQKLIKGSPYPWAYYKCTSFPGCPAKKHVERAMDDPTMLIVTYEEEHCHTQVAIQEYNSLMMAFGSVKEKKE
ncbi:WRKY transcription factor WRKY51-like [Capsicum annuum]|uniref:WRKY transcription factor WRKY51-like n=1 Tax=Capsicum annuum TaxID=4072 RepID=UPI001FB07A38|nr:WRKY transcription factor WRKY51-like [Capsicum annuum]